MAVPDRFACCTIAGLATASVLSAGLAGRGQDGARLGVIRGKVELRHPVGPIEGRPNVGDLGMPGARDVPDRTRSVVYLESAPAAAFEPRPNARARMDQRNEAFVPYVLPITVGTTVDFPNNDRTYHNVFSLSKTRRFDLGRYAAGHSKAIRFDQPGIVRVFCDIHSHMNAFILVFSHRFFAVTSGDGRYHIADVPAGSYAVTAWNEGEARETRRVIVAETGGAVELDFLLR